MFDFDWFDNFDYLDIGLAGTFGENLADDEKKYKEIEKDYDDEDLNQDEDYV